MENRVYSLSTQIREKLNLFYGKGAGYEVFISNDSILVKGRSNNLSGTYHHLVPGEIYLTIEEAKKFLNALDKVIIINDYLDQNGISFKVTSGNQTVFEMNGKEMSYGDIDNLYCKLDKKEDKSSLPLALNMIKAKSLYERFTILYEQVEKKHTFLESYNELISSFEGKIEAIQFAKKNIGLWWKVWPLLPMRNFDITGDEDLVDTIINGEDVSFSNDQISLEKKKKYLSNLENYELRINNFIERLEKEIKKLETYNEKADAILKNISQSNRFNISTIQELPEYDRVSLDTILSEEKQKYDNEIKRKRDKPYVPETIDEKYPWLKDIDQQQRFNLDQRDKTAIMLYKSFMYHLFNNIISYARTSGLEFTELCNDDFVNGIIRKEYVKYVEKLKTSNPSHQLFDRNAVSTVVDDLFPANYVPDYDGFRQIALENLILLEPALSKVTLNQPLTVYRCVYKPMNSSIWDQDLGNAFLSTTTDVDSVSRFMIDRAYDISCDAKKIIYKIELPAGSPIVAFTDDIYLKTGTPNAGFGDGQKEILLDSKNYDFKYVDGDFNRLDDGTYLYSITLKAEPKMERAKSL